MTYEQAITAFEGKTVSITVFIEPPPRAVFYACLARERMGGINILDMTPLYHAGWVKDDLIDTPLVVVDGKEYGKSICLTADIEEAQALCRPAVGRQFLHRLVDGDARLLV